MAGKSPNEAAFGLHVGAEVVRVVTVETGGSPGQVVGVLAGGCLLLPKRILCQ